MINYIYTFSNLPNVTIDKFHICTWDLREQNASVELGVSIPKTDQLPTDFDIYIFAPFLDNRCTHKSLHVELNDAENFKFVFNEKHLGSDNIGQDARNGHIVRYEVNGQQKRMAIIKASQELGDGFVKFRLHKYDGDYECLYCRIYIQTNHKSFSKITHGISKVSYKFDFKINAERSIPKKYADYRDKNGLYDVNVSHGYCLHCVPNDFELSYSDARKLQSIRILELEAFKHYLNDLLSEVKGDYIIIFQKDNSIASISFFSTFSRERIGNKQLTFAIAANIFCSFLFAISTWRNNSVFSWKMIPTEGWIAIVIMVFCVFYCLSLWALFVRFLKKCWRGISKLWKSK